MKSEKIKSEIQLAAGQVVDPYVSEAKFHRELHAFQLVENINRERGVSLLAAQFPEIILSFAAYRVRPLVTVFTVKLNFANYDVEPPSLTFVDPITKRSLSKSEVHCELLRDVTPIVALDSGLATPKLEMLDLIQSHAPANIPFVCLPGIREYHDHPAHSNDSWLNRRGKGEGSLGFIIDQLHKYGTEPINGMIPNAINANRANPIALLIQFQGLVYSRDKFPK